MTELKGASLPCPVPDCPRLRKPEHAMCYFHWRRVPKALQAGVWQTVNIPAAWARAMHAAITALLKKEGAPVVDRAKVRKFQEAVRAVGVKSD